MIELQPLLITAGIFGLAYWLVINSEPSEALKYGVIALFLAWLADLIIPNGVNVFTNLKMLLTVFIGINLISQALFKNSIKQDLIISITAIIINFALVAGGVL